MTDFATGASQDLGSLKGKRVLAGLFDLLLMPIVIGIVPGLLVLAAPYVVQVIVLAVVYIAWLLVRDTVWAPGRQLAGIKLVSENGGAITITQAIIRNVLLFPYILVVGYVLEIIMVLATGQRLADKWAKTKTVAK
jgi:uncharacterized RDD family membrane protein YckC